MAVKMAGNQVYIFGNQAGVGKHRVIEALQDVKGLTGRRNTVSVMDMAAALSLTGETAFAACYEMRQNRFRRPVIMFGHN
jgi:hypothetical protein